jgi:hypothetical protein
MPTVGQFSTGVDTVERNHGMRALRDLRADLLKVQVHCIGIDMRQD